MSAIIDSKALLQDVIRDLVESYELPSEDATLIANNLVSEIESTMYDAQSTYISNLNLKLQLGLVKVLADDNK